MNNKYKEIARLKDSFSKLEDHYQIDTNEFEKEYEKLARSDENYKKLKSEYDEKVQQIINKYDKEGKLLKDSFYDNLNDYLKENHSKVEVQEQTKPDLIVVKDGLDTPVYFDEIGKKIKEEIEESKEGKAYSEIEYELYNRTYENLKGLSQEEAKEIKKAKEAYENLSFLGKAIVKLKERKLQSKEDSSMKL